MAPDEALKWLSERLGIHRLYWTCVDLQELLWRIPDIYHCIAFRLPLKRSDRIETVNSKVGERSKSTSQPNERAFA